MAAQLRDLALHEMSPDGLTKMALNHKFHTHGQGIEQRPHTKADYEEAKDATGSR